MSRAGVGIKQALIFEQQTARLRAAKAALLLGALLMTQTGLAQQTASANLNRSSATTQEEEGLTKPDKPGSEGIRIHGHWIINVKNPDGTVVQHREFDNSLVGGPGLGVLSGDQLLAALISGAGVAGGIGIALITGPVTTPGYDPSAYCATTYPQVPVPAGIKCFGLIEANSIMAAAADTHVLKVVQTGLISQVSYAPSVSIVLSGNFAVLGSYGLTSIDAVQTYLGLCMLPGTVFTPNPVGRFAGTSQSFIRTTQSPSGCASSDTAAGGAIIPPYIGAFTSTNLATPVTNLLANQSVFVSVTLSFS